MARDKGLEEVVRGHLDTERGLTEKPMFGGRAWLLGGHLLCGAREDGVLIRLGKGNDGWALDMDGIVPMMSRGRVMSGWVRVAPETFGNDAIARKLLAAALAFVRSQGNAGGVLPSQPEQVELRAHDGLRVNADLYAVQGARSVLVLCHRSHFNRGEYAEIAPRLVDLGYSCLAVDLRSGMSVLGYVNETAKRAKARGLATGYVAARPDVEAAVAYAASRAGGAPIVLVGSSYSASLALLLASRPSKLSAVVAFSPGEYLKGVSVGDAVAALTVPTFVTAARKEMAETKKLLRGAPAGIVSVYSPRDEGAHGARCLWTKSRGNEGYWRAFTTFLAQTAHRKRISG